jgi:hypothetical protein
MNRVREALGLWVSDVENVELVPDLRLPTGLRRAAERLERARNEERRAHEEYQVLLLDALRHALIASDLSVRDAAAIVGLSPQRVQQLAEGIKRRGRSRPRSAARSRDS